MSSLREGEWAVAESQKGMTQDEVKIVSQSRTHWKTGVFLRGMFELFSGWWVSCCWVPKKDDVRWSENCMSRCSSMKTGIFLRGRIELFAGGWVGCYWIVKRDDPENETNDCKTGERNRKGKYKLLAWCNLIFKEVFHFRYSWVPNKHLPRLSIFELFPTLQCLFGLRLFI